MGLFDSVLSQVLGGGNSKGMDYAVIVQWIEQQGGLPAIIEKCRQSPLGDIVSSWVGTGTNAAITGDHIAQIFTSSSIGQLAEMLGVNADMATALLAQVLPHIINAASPDGKVSPGLALADIAGKLFS